MTLQLHTLLLHAILLCHAHAQWVERETSQGTVRGSLHEALPGRQVERYLGIPYAAPPVGALRLEPPRPPAPWAPRVLNASSLPPACWQRFHDYVVEHNPDFTGPYQEDCLYLNLYRPAAVASTTSASASASARAQGERLLPVLVHVHGGSNVGGMGAMLAGDVLAAAGDMVVVTFNYRLSELGFLGLGEDGFRGNFGLLDQVAALRWVRDNVAHFGGDPGHVTLQGHSAGGADVGLHLVSPLSRGLFRQAVLQSGFPFAYYAVEQPPYSTREKTLHFARGAGCGGGGAVQVKACLQRLPLSAFHSSVSWQVPHSSTIAFLPALVDQHFLTAQPPQLFAQPAAISGQAFMLGVTGDDGLFSEVDVGTLGKVRLGGEEKVRNLLPPTDAVRHVPGVEAIVLHEYSLHGQPALRENSTANTLAQGRLIGDSIFRAPGTGTAQSLAAAGKPVFFYSFDYDSPLSPGVGVPHGADLFYLFGCPFTGHARFNYSQEDREVSSELMALWASFVHQGAPRTRQGRALPRYTQAGLEYFRVTAAGNGSAAVLEGSALRARQVALWNELLPRLAQSQPETSQVTRMRTALIATASVLGTLVVGLLLLLLLLTSRHWRSRRKDYRNCAQNECEA